MKRLLLAGAAFAALIAGPAMAADLGAPVYRAPAVYVPVSSWTGFYAGFNGGYGWSNPSTTATPFQNFPGLAVIPPFAFSQNVNGAVFGGQLGYNYQIANWVVGVEGDFDWAGINNASSSLAISPGSGGTATDGFMAHQNIRWLASIRGRLGYAWGPSLLYVTGGAAWDERDNNLLVSTNTNVAGAAASAASFSTTKSGWVIGAGYEWMITPKWIVRGEYLHYGFNSGDITPVSVPCGFGGPAVCGVNVSSSNNNIDVVRLGLSYKFGGYAAAPAFYR
jgi:outer membrane immunogenic protein